MAKFFVALGYIPSDREYAQIEQPIAARKLRKVFGSWPRMIKIIENCEPELMEQVGTKEPTTTATIKEKMAQAAAGSKVVTPEELAKELAAAQESLDESKDETESNEKTV